MSDKPRQSRKRVTAKAVQDTENKPHVPHVDVKPEIDEDGWGDNSLTLRQRLFVQYFTGEAAGNSTKAARLAGYRDDNETALRVTAHRTLTNANVQRAIQLEFGKRFGSPDDVKNSIAAIANGNAADYLKAGDDGKLHLDLDAMAEAGQLGLLQQVQEERIEVGPNVSTTKLRVKLYDRLKALEILAKMNGQLKDTVQHTGEVKASISVTADFDHDAYRRSFEQYIAGRMAGARNPASEANGN